MRLYEEIAVKTNEYARMAQHEQSYWWHVGRLEIIQTYLKHVSRNKSNSAILNIGCGTGGAIGTLEQFGDVDNVDTSDDAIAFVKARGYKNIIKIDDIALPFEDETYDIVGAFDVLEHIEDHERALSEWK